MKLASAVRFGLLGATGFLLALLVTLGLLVVAGVPAAADHKSNPNVEGLEHVQVSHQADCGKTSITLVVPEGTPEDYLYRVQVEVDGEIVGSTDLVQGPGASSLGMTFEEDQSDGSVEISYYFLDATEWDIVDADMDYQDSHPDVGDAYKSFDVDTDCAQPSPSPDPSPSGSPIPTPSVAPSSEPETSAPEDIEAVAGPELPKTGSPLPTILGAAIVLLIVGVGLILLGRRSTRR